MLDLAILITVDKAIAERICREYGRRTQSELNLDQVCLAIYALQLCNPVCGRFD